MRNTVRCSLLAGVLVAAATTAMPAAAEDGRFILGVSGGTLGVGPELAYRFSDRLGVRVNGGFLNHNDSENLDDIDYDGKLKLNSIGGMLDWFPLGGGFRISLGGRANKNEIGLVGAPTTPVEIGNVTYTPQQIGSLLGTVTTNNFAPMLSFGYGGKLAPGFTLGFELGVMLQGSPKIKDLQATGSLASNQQFQTQLEIERQQAEDDISNFKLWPILQLHLLYRF